MGNLQQTFDVPYKSPVVGSGGFLTRQWEWFFRSIWERLYALGSERSFTLSNNQSVASDVTGLRLDARGVSQAIFEYLVQRVTTGGGAVELVESGILIFVYRPTDENWAIVTVSEELPDDAGVEFSITAGGQVQYTTTNVSGSASISRLNYRLRTLSAKHTQYSAQGYR